MAQIPKKKKFAFWMQNGNNLENFKAEIFKYLNFG
jgi:hypothetical protein